MKRKCVVEYKDQERQNKTKAVMMMFSEWMKKNPNEYIHVGIFNPSITCLDLDIAVYKNLIREDTKLIFFENFKYLKNKKDRSEYLFKKKVMSHIPMVKEENVFFHFGELETLQLGGTLHHLCGDNIEKVNFMFLDFCGELKTNHAKWLYDNRDLIEKNSFQFYTICIQAKMRSDCCNKLVLAKEYWQDVPFYVFRVTKRKSLKMERLKEIVNYWQFNCSHILDTEKRKKNYKPEISPIVYSDGVNLMGIFNGVHKTTEDYLWKFYHGFLCNVFVEKSENIDDDGIIWDSMRNGKFTDYEIMLFRDMPIPENANIDYQSFIDIVQKPERKEGSAILRDKIISEFPYEFFPRMVYEYRRKYYHSSLHAARCFMIFNKYFLGKTIFDKKTGKYGKFVLDNSFARTGSQRSRAKYRFEYIENIENSSEDKKENEQYQYFQKIENEIL